MTIKFIYFDIGGVLNDHYAAQERVAEYLNLEKNEVKEFFALHTDDLDRGVLLPSDLNQKFISKFYPKKPHNIDVLDIYVSNFVKINVTHDLIHKLKNSHKIGILSNVGHSAFDLIKKYDLIPDIEYDSIIKSADIRYIKPEKKIYEHALVMSGSLPENTLLIDDKKENVDAATSFGWRSFEFDRNNPEESIRELKDLLNVGL
jgi:HAD superfamily hydrolase (TIGR01509 family)